MSTKYAVVLMAREETPDGRGRLLHAYTTAIDLAKAGAVVEFYFDGIGVENIGAFHAKDNPFSKHYVYLFEQVLPFAKACGVCTKHFKVDDAANELGIELVSHENHRSTAQLMLDGYNVVTF